MNYLIIDEANFTGIGANTVVSLLHNYQSLGGKHHLHADNCVGQNKNNAHFLVKPCSQYDVADLAITFRAVCCM